MTTIQNILTISISILGAFFVSVFTLIFNIRKEKKQMIIQSVTQNRMDWIENVRQLLSEFLCAYVSNASETELRKLKAKCELYFNNKEFYNLLIQQMELCCKQPYNSGQPQNYEKLVHHCQYVLARSWERIKMEGGQSIQENKKIKDNVDIRTETLKPN